jgi:hypothetical protein
MESEIALPCSQKPTISLYPKPDESNITSNTGYLEKHITAPMYGISAIF